MSQMPKDVEARIRALPGNKVCCDCSNVNPQWASVSYGSLMCLECSGHHRSLGVHLSFVRSVAMDAWKEREIAAMERSGGNDNLVKFFESKKIPKSMSIPTKYNTKQAEYYRNRLNRWLDGKTEPPPDPGNYDPVNGSDAQGAEPLPGETPDEYNARQAKLRELARERLRQKFGNGGIGGGMQGMGCEAPPEQEGLRGMLGGIGNFVKANVIQNENLRSAVGGAINGARSAYAEGNISGYVGGLLNREGGGGGGGGGYNRSQSMNGGVGGNKANMDEDDEAFFAQNFKGGSGGGGRSNTGSGYNSSPSPQANASEGSTVKSSKSTGFDFKNDDDWGSLFADKKNGSSAPANGASNGNGANRSRAQTAPAPAPPELQRAKTAPAASPAAPAPAADKSPSKPKASLQEADDFFSAFGV
eukprot:TRINITY_DN236_c1_g1_i1.p1 TRINITY_DN236_c1_g1~~TRINITY_DN236_c1_g1_i1.p1  ORF type:complete len:416 (-),score=142.97 TRINITY_DN236_c1_g1_i1:198-1445(-)